MSNSICQTIVGAPNVAVDSAQTCAPRSAVTASGVDNAQNSAVDRASVSQLGQVLDAAAHSAGRLSSFRPAVVAQFRAAIANGDYQPDPGQVAARVAQALSRSGGAPS